MSVYLHLIAFWLLFSAGSCQVWAKTCQDSVESQTETLITDPYFFESRPDILSRRVQRKPHNLVSKIQSWSLIKKASYWMAAEVLALYPKQHIVFLARDASILYDFARLLTQNTSHAKRIHLLSISQGSISKKELADYIAFQGITDSVIKESGLIVVDSGYRSSVLDKFRDLFPEVAKNIQGHMVHAKKKLYSGRRTAAMSFAAFDILNPGVIGHYELNDYSGVYAFENLPQTTSRTTEYVFMNQGWFAKSLNVPGPSEIQAAHAWQQDIKWEYALALHKPLS